MKKTKAEREAYNAGKHDGYMEGYAKGFYNGNPFNKILDALKNVVEILMTPEVLQALIEVKEKAEKEKLISCKKGEEEKK